MRCKRENELSFLAQGFPDLALRKPGEFLPLPSAPVSLTWGVRAGHFPLAVRLSSGLHPRAEGTALALACPRPTWLLEGTPEEAALMESDLRPHFQGLRGVGQCWVGVLICDRHEVGGWEVIKRVPFQSARPPLPLCPKLLTNWNHPSKKR